MVDECLLDAQTMDVVFRYILLPAVLFAGWRAFSVLNAACQGC